jgi:hypothetical protein
MKPHHRLREISMCTKLKPCRICIGVALRVGFVKRLSINENFLSKSTKHEFWSASPLQILHNRTRDPAPSTKRTTHAHEPIYCFAHISFNVDWPHVSESALLDIDKYTRVACCPSNEQVDWTSHATKHAFKRRRVSEIGCIPPKPSQDRIRWWNAGGASQYRAWSSICTKNIRFRCEQRNANNRSFEACVKILVEFGFLW